MLGSRECVQGGERIAMVQLRKKLGRMGDSAVGGKPSGHKNAGAGRRQSPCAQSGWTEGEWGGNG